MTHRLRSLAALTAAFPLLALAAPAQVQVRWFQTFDGPDHANDVAAAVAVDASGAVYVAVNDTNGSTFEPRLFKYDASGALAWSRLLVAGPGSVSAVALDPDNGDAIVVGSAPTMPILQQDAFVARYAPDGTRRWFRRWDGPDSRIDSATAVVLGGGGTAYVVANTQRADFLEDFAILAYTAAGALAWEAVLPDTHTEAGSAGLIAIDASGNLLVTGYGGATYPGNAVLVKVTPAGTLAWLREYDGPGAAFDRGYDVASDAQGNVYLAGLVSMNGGPLTPDYGGFLAKYDPQGNLLWDRVVDDPANGIDSLEAVEVDYRGNVVVAGRLGDATRSARAWLAQYDPQGNLVWDRPWSVDDEHFEIWSALALDAGGGITVAGTAYKPLDYPAYDSDVEVQRYDKHGNLRWAHAGLFSVPNGDYPTDLALGPGGEVAYAGVTNAFPGGPGGRPRRAAARPVRALLLRRRERDGVPVRQLERARRPGRLPELARHGQRGRRRGRREPLERHALAERVLRARLDRRVRPGERPRQRRTRPRLRRRRLVPGRHPVAARRRDRHERHGDVPRTGRRPDLRARVRGRPERPLLPGLVPRSGELLHRRHLQPDERPGDDLGAVAAPRTAANEARPAVLERAAGRVVGPGSDPGRRELYFSFSQNSAGMSCAILSAPFAPP
jgi:hypothetical protein